MSGTLPWYVARSAGLVAWALLAATVCWGLVISTRTMRRWAKPAWVLDLHRFLGGLAVVFVGVHIGALLLDTYVHFGVVQVLVPFASHWHPAKVAWGVVALYLLIAVEVTSLLRGRLPRGWWRRTHMATLPLFALATLHGVTAGTDRRNMVVIFTLVAATSLIGALVAVRIARRADRRRPSAPRRPDPVGRPPQLAGTR
jgi:predicted ferric reductase